MNLREYQLEVMRTMPDLGSLLSNSIHMTMGIATELLEEFPIAVMKNDKVNIAEELADAQWYLCNYATLYGITLPEKLDLIPVDFLTKDELTTQSNKLNICMGRLLDYDKKELAYGKETDIKDKRYTMFQLLEAIETAASIYRIDMDSARLKVINKLKFRYPEKFTSDKAINRDTDAERKILEA